MKRAPLISRDFEETKRAPLKFQIFRKINETRTPKFGPGGVVKGGLLIFIDRYVITSY